MAKVSLRVGDTRSLFSGLMPTGRYRLHRTERRVELLVMLYDIIHAYGPISAYAAAKRLGQSPKHGWRKVRVLVDHGLVERVPPPPGKPERSCWGAVRVKEHDRRAAVLEIGRFAAEGVVTRKLRRTIYRHIEVAANTARRLLGEVSPIVDDYLADDWRFR